jgi:hypothetical protein
MEMCYPPECSVGYITRFDKTNICLSKFAESKANKTRAQQSETNYLEGTQSGGS